MADTKISAMSAATSLIALVAAGVQGGSNVKFDPTLLGLLMQAPLNIGVAASVGASALTVSLKGADGNDPSATNPVYIPFRNATAGTGTPTPLTATAATSVTISSGSTMGTSNSTAFRLWLVAFNDAGTLRLGLVNCLSGANIMALRPGLASSLAEGGAGAADSAQQIYTGTAVTSKAMTVLGYLEWSSGLAAAGTWSAGPDITKIWQPGDPLPGDTIQIRRTDTGAVATGTTTVPVDDTIPQNTEGDQYMSQAITPMAAANILRITARGQFVSSTASALAWTMSVFQDSTAGALKTSYSDTPSGVGVQLDLQHQMLAGTSSSTTMKIRAGCHAAGTTTFNGNAGSRRYGGAINSFVEVIEVMA